MRCLKRYTLKDFAAEIIKENGRPMTTSEIWLYGVKQGYDKKGGFIGKTPWITIGQTLMIDIKENSKSKFIVNEQVRPKEYSLESTPVSIKAQEKILPKENVFKFNEKDIHKHLTYFAYTYLERVYTKNN